jgi:glyoxylase-like metal-dependent hydrolase (beta-lactamase superfamily II)/rhodanese-related sulfurtransferase
MTAVVTSISAAGLADRLAAGEPWTVLDVRPDAGWVIEAASARVVHVPALEAAADVAGLAERLDGPVVVVCARGVTAEPIAHALRAHGVEAVVLDGGMRGWIGVLQSRPVDLDLPGVAVRQVQRPGRGCLSYVVAAGDEALVVDPAPDAGFYERLADDLGARITVVADTHLHADHLSGARELARRTGAVLRLPAAALRRGVAYADEVLALADGEELWLGAITVRVIALPGHTTDMTGFLVADRALLSGDSLFADGVARPDLQSSDPAGSRAMARLLHTTLHERVLPLGDDVVLLPGHAPPGVRGRAVAATLGELRPFLPELTIADAGAFAKELLAGMPPRPANHEAIIAANAGRRAAEPELETGGNRCAAR